GTGCEDDAARDGSPWPHLPGRRRLCAPPLRRGPQLPQPPPQPRRALPRLHPEPHRGDHRHHPRGGRHQPSSQPGGDDTAAYTLEAKASYIRKAGSDGSRIHHRATLKKVVSDRKASLDYDGEVRPAMRTLVQKQFEKGASIPFLPFPADGSAVADTPRLTLV